MGPSPNHFCPLRALSALCSACPEHLSGTVLPLKMVQVICHSCWSLGLTQLPSGGQGETIRVPAPVVGKQAAVSEVSESAAHSWKPLGASCLVTFRKKEALTAEGEHGGWGEPPGTKRVTGGPRMAETEAVHLRVLTVGCLNTEKRLSLPLCL